MRSARSAPTAWNPARWGSPRWRRSPRAPSPRTRPPPDWWRTTDDEPPGRTPRPARLPRRWAAPVSWDSYLDLEHGVLRNRLGITDPAELAQAEADITLTQLAYLTLHPIEGNFDLAHLQAIHYELFSPIYGWAGQLRTV